MRRLVLVLLTTATLAGCIPPPPQYKDPLSGIAPISLAAFPVDAPVTVEQPAGLIVSDNTEMFLEYDKKADENVHTLGMSDDAAHHSVDPKSIVDRLVNLLRSRYANIELIDDMNAAARLGKKTVFVLDVKAIFGQAMGQVTQFDLAVFVFDAQRNPVTKITAHGEHTNPLIRDMEDEWGIQDASNQALQQLDQKMTRDLR